MAATDLAQRLRASPELFPLSIDPASDRVSLIRLAPVDYEKASFLDQRVQAPAAGDVAFRDLAHAAYGLPVACDYIFHTGHVGSTLLSRLLGVHPAVFSLREPQSLRLFTEADLAGRPWNEPELEAHLAVFQALYSRTWSHPKRALIKATSFVCALAPRLMARNVQAKAIWMTVAPETYIATILSGANLGDIRQAAAIRFARLVRRVGEPSWTPADFSPGELAAFSWAVDMDAYAEADRIAPGRVLLLDFDAFLADPRQGLAAALAHLHGRADPADVARIAASPYLQRYSKAPEYGFGPEVRAQVLAEAERQAGVEIARGETWLKAAAERWPTVAEAWARLLSLKPPAAPTSGGD